MLLVGFMLAITFYLFPSSLFPSLSFIFIVLRSWVLLSEASFGLITSFHLSELPPVCLTVSKGENDHLGIPLISLFSEESIKLCLVKGIWGFSEQKATKICPSEEARKFIAPLFCNISCLVSLGLLLKCAMSHLKK